MPPLVLLPSCLWTKCHSEGTLLDKELTIGTCYFDDDFLLETTVHMVHRCPGPRYPPAPGVGWAPESPATWPWKGGWGREREQTKASLSAGSSEIWSQKQPGLLTCSARHRLGTDGPLIRVPRLGSEQHMPQEAFMGQDARSHSGDGRWQERAVSGHLITAGKFKHKPCCWANTPLIPELTQADSGYGPGAKPPPLWESVSPSAKWGAESDQRPLKIFWSHVSLGKKFWEWNPHICVFIYKLCMHAVVPIHYEYYKTLALCAPHVKWGDWMISKVL